MSARRGVETQAFTALAGVDCALWRTMTWSGSMVARVCCLAPS